MEAAAVSPSAPPITSRKEGHLLLGLKQGPEEEVTGEVKAWNEEEEEKEIAATAHMRNRASSYLASTSWDGW